MKCLILAAGYATRLYPPTKDYPKPLLQVRRKAILDWLLEDIEGSGHIDGYAVVTNHKFARFFHQWADNHNLKIDIVDDGTSTNESRLGAVCDIQYAIDRLSLRDDLLVIAGDNLLDFSLQSFISYAIEKGTSCTMRYLETDESKLRKCGVSEVDADDKLISLEEKPENPKSQWATPPFYFYTKEDVRKIRDAINDGCRVDAPGSLVSWMCRHSVMHSMEMPGHRFDIGTLESYDFVKRNYKGIMK